MWNLVLERVTLSFLEITCIVLAFLIPSGVYQMNKYLHKDMDPPWKKEEEEQQ